MKFVYYKPPFKELEWAYKETGGRVMNFSSLQSSVQKFGMNQALKYLEKDPETNIPKLLLFTDNQWKR